MLEVTVQKNNGQKQVVVFYTNSPLNKSKAIKAVGIAFGKGSVATVSDGKATYRVNQYGMAELEK